MGKGKATKDTAPPPALSLKMDATTETSGPREVAPADGESGFMVPCTVTGLGAGLSGGTLGWVMGFGGYWIKSLRGGGKWKASLVEAWGSAKTFAIMGGLYATVNCMMLRLRQKSDAWNGAASGCATGLALGWKQGPLSALQSCAMLGAFSYFVDGMGGSEAHAMPAAAGHRLEPGSSPRGSGRSSELQLRQWRQRQRQRVVERMLSASEPCRFAVELGGGGPAGRCREAPPLP